MQANEYTELRSFIGSTSVNAGCNLFLPAFSGPVSLSQPALQYPGGIFSERDAKSALYVSSLLGQVFEYDQVQVEEAKNNPLPIGTSFLFGSRSNQITQWVLQNQVGSKLFNFNYGADWQIVGKDGRVFSLTDPSTLSRAAYEQKTDYGVVSRVSTFEGQCFVIAGLGGRATEGCGYYFARNWKSLFQKYGQQDFAVILEFSPPLDPKKSKVVAEYKA
mgnify:CR=1 FL=1